MNCNKSIIHNLSRIVLTFFVIGGSAPIHATEITGTVAVIGTGDVGSALGPRFAELGYTVVYGSRDSTQPKVQELVARTGARASASSQAKAAEQADIVVLAVPWSATKQVVSGLGDLAGKIIIDITNPIRVADDGLMQTVVPTSGGELVQSWAPGAFVVKAFNTMGAFVMADPDMAGGPATVPMAGNDAAAKQQVGEIIEALGFEVVDVGPLRFSRELEGMAILYVTPYLRNRRDESWEYYFRVRSQ